MLAEHTFLNVGGAAKVHAKMFEHARMHAALNIFERDDRDLILALQNWYSVTPSKYVLYNVGGAYISECWGCSQGARMLAEHFWLNIFERDDRDLILALQNWYSVNYSKYVLYNVDGAFLNVGGAAKAHAKMFKHARMHAALNIWKRYLYDLVWNVYVEYTSDTRIVRLWGRRKFKCYRPFCVRNLNLFFKRKSPKCDIWHLPNIWLWGPQYDPQLWKILHILKNLC